MFDLTQILEDFVDVAMPFCGARAREAAMYGSVRPDRDPIVQHRRPEDLKADIAAVLHEQEDWTIEQLCARLSLDWTKPTQVSVGLVLKEFGWQSRVISIRRIKHWRRSFDNYVPVMRFSTAEAERVVRALSQKSRWTTEELCETLFLPKTLYNRQALGYVLRDQGWKKSGRRGYYVLPS